MANRNGHAASLTPFEPGNRVAEKHGVYASRAEGIGMPVVQLGPIEAALTVTPRGTCSTSAYYYLSARG